MRPVSHNFRPELWRSSAVQAASGVVSKAHDLQLWLDSIPYLKLLMDPFFAHRPRQDREFQQLVARKNNQSAISNETDYFIADIEYAHGSARFAVLALLLRHRFLSFVSESSHRSRDKCPSAQEVDVQSEEAGSSDCRRVA